MDQNGNIASWMIPGKLVKGMGGAMDLVAGAQNIVVTMTHADKYGNSKLLESCTLPLTGVGCVKKIVTDLAVLEVRDGAFHLLERAPGISVEEIQQKTAGKLVVAGDIPEMQFA
ncbi:succinyl-CoA--3-ketoacid-CoA transferase [Alishewanella longhuensis]